MLKHHTISFKHAFHGIWTAIITQTNMRIHFIIAALVLFLSTYFALPFDQIIDLVLAIALVMTAEMVNTSLEFMSDAITIEHNEFIGRAKDVAAGAVLLSSIFAVVMGLMIFVPKFL